jgi:hypothetical protein
MYEDAPHDIRVGVFSFGLILYEVLAGSLTPQQIMKKAIFGIRPALPDGIEPFFGDLISRCWSATPADEPSFAEICVLLKDPHFLLTYGADEGDVQTFIEWAEAGVRGSGRTRS